MTIGSRVSRTLLGGCLAIWVSACVPGASDSPADPRPERVQVGYGETEVRSLTGSVSSLTGRELGRMRFDRVEDMLQGRVSGLRVIRKPNGQISLQIRGITSINGNNEPLVVIDGMPIGPMGLSSVLDGINPQDIARIDVLKDAGSTAIYGLRGANGVLVITTKRTP